jgi:hypothetical protein
MEVVNECLLYSIGTRQRHLCEQSRVEAAGDRDSTSEHCDAEAATYPITCPLRSLHRGENLAPDEKGNGQ